MRHQVEVQEGAVASLNPNVFFGLHLKWHV